MFNIYEVRSVENLTKQLRGITFLMLLFLLK